MMVTYIEICALVSPLNVLVKLEKCSLFIMSDWSVGSIVTNLLMVINK